MPQNLNVQRIVGRKFYWRQPICHEDEIFYHTPAHNKLSLILSFIQLNIM